VYDTDRGDARTRSSGRLFACALWLAKKARPFYTAGEYDIQPLAVVYQVTVLSACRILSIQTLSRRPTMQCFGRPFVAVRFFITNLAVMFG